MINLTRTELTSSERMTARHDLATSLTKAGGLVEVEAAQLSSVLVPDSARRDDVVWRVEDGGQPAGWVWTRHPDNGHVAVVTMSLPAALAGEAADALRQQSVTGGGVSLDYVVSRGDEVATKFHDALRGDLTSVLMTAEVADVPLPISIKLHRMDVARFERFLEESIEGHAADLHASGTVPDLELARTESRRQTEQFLAQGIDTPGHFLWSARDNGDEVGTLWIQRREHRDFIYRIEVDPAHRRRGYGGQILRAAAAETRKAGRKWLSLNVFGHNLGAQALYRQEGYQATQQSFSRSLTDQHD